MATMSDSPSTPYDQMGGAPFFATLVHRFYEGVAADEALRAMYPEEDLGPAEERLRMFLEQYWGGPGTYSELRGHPRLRMRHNPYRIDDAARERWLDAMRTALDHAMAEHALDPALEQELWHYLVGAAFAMTNVSTDDSRSGLIMHENPQ
jgi:hemoglobin